MEPVGDRGAGDEGVGGTWGYSWWDGGQQGWRAQWGGPGGSFHRIITSRTSPQHFSLSSLLLRGLGVTDERAQE